MIEVLFFAELQDALGEEKMVVEASGLTVSALKEKFIEADHLPKFHHAMVAINEEYAQDTTVLKDGDVVAFIPPVSGG